MSSYSFANNQVESRKIYLSKAFQALDSIGNIRGSCIEEPISINMPIYGGYSTMSDSIKSGGNVFWVGFFRNNLNEEAKSGLFGFINEEVKLLKHASFGFISENENDYFFIANYHNAHTSKTEIFHMIIEGDNVELKSLFRSDGYICESFTNESKNMIFLGAREKSHFAIRVIDNRIVNEIEFKSEEIRKR